jgi:hypothetical protein
LDFENYYIAFRGIPVGFPGVSGIEAKEDQILINNQLQIRKTWSFPEKEGFASISLDYPQEPDYPYFLIYHSAEGLEPINEILSTFRFLE